MRAGQQPTRKATMDGMTEPQVEMITDASGFPHYAVRVTVPADVWWQEQGRPGWVRFEVFEVEATEMDGTPVYRWPGSASTLERPTHSLDEAERCGWGDVKWDGCVNYEVGTDDVMLHACSSEGVAHFLRAIQRGYDIALDLVGGGL